MPFICNLYGAPGSGKSTTATGVFHLLKLAGYNVEYVSEVAKDLVWEDRHTTLKSQPYVFAKQLRNIERVLPKVECIVTDSPLMLSVYYDIKYGGGRYPQSFRDFVTDVVSRQHTLDFFMERVKPYNPVGRNQDEAGSDEIRDELRELLVGSGVRFANIDGDKFAPQKIAALAIDLMDHQRRLVAA